MLKLQPNLKVKETQRAVVVSDINYSKEQISSLFKLGILTPVWFYKSKAKRLFDLGLSFEDSEYLLHTVELSVDEIVKCCNEFGVTAELIRKNAWTKSVLLNDILNIVPIVGGIENLTILLAKRLSIENIKTLFQQLKLSYKDTISLVNCGYKVCEIESLVKGKITCSELVELAYVIETSEVYALFKEERQNLVFLLSVQNILKRKIENLDSAMVCYQTLYESIPDGFCRSLITCSRSIPKAGRTTKIDLTYEEIFIHYMDLAGGKIVEYVKKSDIVTPLLFKALEKITQNCDSSFKFIPVTPFLLAAIWCALDMSLEKQYLRSIECVNAETIGRSILSFLVSSMCGVTGYFHAGGVGLPYPNITSYIKTYFNNQQFIKDNAPNIYNKIPHRLLFNTSQEFETLIKEKQISAAQGLSMVYTFRVGDTFLRSLLGVRIFSFKSAQNVFKSLWSLPQKEESTRMYFIYSGIPMYTKLNLKDVFVSIP